MLSHECEFVPVSHLHRACLVMLSSSSGALQHRLNFKQGKRGTEQIMQPCNALMSCHAVRLRQIINLDHLSCHDIIVKLLPCASPWTLHVSWLQVRGDGGEEKEEERGE